MSNFDKDVEKKEHCWLECKFMDPLWKIVWSFLKQLKTELPYDPAALLLVYNLKKMLIVILKDSCTTMFIEMLFTIAKI